MIQIAVDCSVVNGNPGTAEYRGLDLETSEILFSFKFPSKATNNIAEWVAIINAIQYCKDNEIKNALIYSDSKTAISWTIKRRHRSKMKVDYPDLYTKELENILRYNSYYIANEKHNYQIKWWNKKKLGKEIPADYGRKK